MRGLETVCRDRLFLGFLLRVNDFHSTPVASMMCRVVGRQPRNMKYYGILLH